MATPTPASPAPLNRTAWLICIIASIGFAFDIYELLMLPLVIKPAMAALSAPIVDALVADGMERARAAALWAPGGAEYEVVYLERADQESAYAGVDVRGRILFTGTPARAAKPIASRLGAVGIISDSASRHGRREAFELPDAVTWENSWKDRAQGGWGFDAADRECFGFLLSPRQGARFREWLRRQAAPRVRANRQLASSPRTVAARLAVKSRASLIFTPQCASSIVTRGSKEPPPPAGGFRP